MKQKYITKYKYKLFEIPQQLMDIWNNVVNLCENNNIIAAQVYVEKQLHYNIMNVNIKKGLSIIQQDLLYLQRHSYLLDPLHIYMFKEYGIAYKIWLPLFDSLFGGDSPITTYISESVNSYSSSEKQALYNQNHNNISHHNISFKIDFGIVYHNHNENLI